MNLKITGRTIEKIFVPLTLASLQLSEGLQKFDWILSSNNDFLLKEFQTKNRRTTQ